VKKIQFTFLVVWRFITRYFHRTKKLVKSSQPLKNHSHNLDHLPKANSYKSSSGMRLRYHLTSGQQKYIFLGVIGILVMAFFWQIRLRYYHQSHLTEGIVGVYTKGNLPLNVAHLLSEPLVFFDKNGQPQPGLATEWKVEDDAKLYTFKLKDNLYWHDGSKVKSSDLKYNLPNVETSYPDERTIVFKLSDSFAPFPTLLTSPVFKGDSLIGLGKYSVVYEDLSRDIVTKLVLIPFPEGSNSGLPDISIRFYPDEKTARTAFMLGEIDSLIGLSDLGDLTSAPSVEVTKITNYNRLVAIFYNTEDPLLSDKNLRKALTCASPKIKDEEPAQTSIQPNSWAFNNELKDMLGNAEMGKTYLDKTNLTDDKTITLTTVPSLSKLGNEVIKSWQQMGIKATLRIEAGMPQNFQALLTPQTIPSDPDQYTLWHSTQGKTNLSKYLKSPRSDKDLEDGRKLSDLEKRKEKYLDFQKVLQDDSPATFLYFPKTNILYRSKTGDNLNKVLSLQIR
jgi:peptide/nickel transport system substrate-binding protein